MISPRLPLLLIGLEALVLGGFAVHARTRQATRAGEQGAIDAVARVLPGADLAAAGAARHLRFPSLEEPGAAFAEAPSAPDLDPAGAALAPPIDVYVDVEARPQRKPSPKPLGQVAPR